MRQMLTANQKTVNEYLKTQGRTGITHIAKDNGLTLGDVDTALRGLRGLGLVESSGDGYHQPKSSN